MTLRTRRHSSSFHLTSGVFLRVILAIFLALESTSGLAQTPEIKNVPTDTIETSNAPIAYHAEGSREFKTESGATAQISADITVLQPNDESGVDALETQAKQKFSEADKLGVELTLTVEDDYGQITEATRPAFLSALRRMSEKTKNTFREMNTAAATDFKNMFWTTLIMVSARGGVNYWGGFKMGITQHFAHTPSVVAGATSFLLSATLLIYGSFYAKWLKINQGYGKLLAKGFGVQFVYLVIVLKAAELAGAQVSDGFVDFISGVGMTSIMGAAVQTPFAVTTATLADEYTQRHPGNKTAALAVAFRNLASVGMSFYVAVLTYLKLSGNPHADNLAWVVGGPATVFVAYKQNWKQKTIDGFRWVRQELGFASHVFSFYAFEKLNGLIRNLPKDHDDTLREITRISDQQMDQIRPTACREMAILAGAP